jgi:hypothetical protein
MQNTVVRALLIMVLVLADAATGSAADTLFTPPLIGGPTAAGTTSLLLCYVVNTAPGAQAVSISILSLSGANLTSPATNVLAAGTGTFTQASALSAGAAVQGYCKVTGDGPPRSLLVSLCNSTRVGTTDNCVAAVAGQSQGSGGF